MASKEILQENTDNEPAAEVEPVIAAESSVAGPALLEDKLESTGYACEFVEPPPEALQVECPVCLQVLREPHLLSCCGYKFCKACIVRIEDVSKPCPLCSEADFQVVPEKSLYRTLNGLKVFCSHKKGGCDWVGELRGLDAHLNIEPENEENRHDGCGFVVLKCMYCQQCLLRESIKEHEEEKCLRRPYSCDYCKDFMATFEEVVYVHYKECKSYPMSCPNKCDLPYAIERQNLDYHIGEDCPLSVISCNVGCDVQVKREDMPAHMSENSITHISYLASKVKEQENTIASLRQQLEHVIHSVCLTASVIPPCTFKIPVHGLLLDDWVSDPFYTHPCRWI